MKALPGALIPLCALMLLLFLASPPAPAQLPPDVQADLLTVEAERQLEVGNHSAAVAKFEELLRLREEHGLDTPAAFWFKRAWALREAGYFGKAVESAERYVLEAGREGEHYRAALELLAAMPSVGDVFRDCANCPEMVLIPSGSYRMGCVSGYDRCNHDEFPVHEVTIPSFALSKHEVTFDQWDACVAAGGCGGYRPDDKGWGRGNRPVIYVSWEDAQSFVVWLSEVTGHAYRLPTESEWEYAARAGTETIYSWGNQIGSGRANCADRSDSGYGSCGDSYEHTSPTGSFPANVFGLHDMHGNVEEWVEDCWNDSYEGAPSDGSAWLIDDCQRVLRGGNWFGNPWLSRSARRASTAHYVRIDDIGFRVARALTP